MPEYLPKTPSLLNAKGDGFNPELFASPAEAERLVVQQEPASSPWENPRQAEQAIRDKRASAVMLIPRNLLDQLQQEHDIDIPIKYSSVDETSAEDV